MQSLKTIHSRANNATSLHMLFGEKAHWHLRSQISARSLTTKTVSTLTVNKPTSPKPKHPKPADTVKAGESELSNRQKFNRIEPSARVYEKLEKLGFGTLRQTKRFSVVRGKQKPISEKDGPPDPEYSFPLLSFFAGAKTPASFPPESLVEIGFVGRSNVGKSSLINSLADSTVVRTSDKPGLTQQINFFSAGSLFHMVDMPGYGFAFVDDIERQQWRDLMENYAEKRTALKRLFVVIDARHGLKVADHDFLKMLDSKKVRFQIVLTKCDLQVLPTLARRVMIVQESIRTYRHSVKDVLVVSSKTGSGVNQMRKEILFLTGKLQPREFYKPKKEEIPQKHNH
ncbi:P-loop containing nucleoside triphosphate hydrolase protein [Phycomyces nitens]|nr:P-loop containing nucleoside triphosphate hydrolase protein [Phycomyces nitens]